ncbi:MAG: Fic family protein [Alistipes sp.]
MNENNDTTLRLPKIAFEMPITDSIMELEQLRYKILQGTTQSDVFFQLKHVFHMLESIGSSRIEGNNTTVMDYVESTKFPTSKSLFDSEDILEIKNIEAAMLYIEDNITTIEINKMFIRELHTLVVEGLSAHKEGASHPGLFREVNVKINGSTHVPPDYEQIDAMMDELMAFVNQSQTPKYDLLKIAIAHHRFVWIHPFENGNGRVVRLFTYALLLKFIFKSGKRIINPTAVFCSDRNKYYDYLSKADKGSDQGLIEWSEYVLSGLKTEIEKIDKLLDYQYLHNNILQPMLVDALNNRYISPQEFNILKITISKQTIQAGDIKNILKEKTSSDISRIIRELINKQMLRPINLGARKYTISFHNNYLLRSILSVLDKNNFLPNNK